MPKNKVLIVDDMHDLADSLAILLTLSGHETRTAYDGQQAVNAAAAERPDVAILDLSMPVMDGFQAARKIRDQFPEPPPVLVAVSALSETSVQQRLAACGFDHFLAKPVDLDRLLSIVDQASA